MSKAVKETKEFIKNPVKGTVKLVESLAQPVTDTVRSVGHVL